MVIKDNRGQAIVEFAIAAVLFFSLLFMVMDLGLMFYVKITMQNAVREGARYAITGRTDAGPNQRAAVTTTIINKSNGLYDKHPTVLTFSTVNVQTQALTTLPTAPGVAGSNTVGTGGQIIVVQLTYSWPLLTPFLRPFFTNGTYTFTVSSTMRNEV
jgi:Flp pilus assembly protein TadG